MDGRGGLYEVVEKEKDDAPWQGLVTAESSFAERKHG